MTIQEIARQLVERALPGTPGGARVVLEMIAGPSRRTAGGFGAIVTEHHRGSHRNSPVSN